MADKRLIDIFMPILFSAYPLMISTLALMSLTLQPFPLTPVTHGDKRVREWSWKIALWKPSCLGWGAGPSQSRGSQSPTFLQPPVSLFLLCVWSLWHDRGSSLWRLEWFIYHGGGLALTESEQASSCKQSLPILYEEDMQFMELRNLGQYFKWRHLRAKRRKGLKKYGDWYTFSPPYLCLSVFLFSKCPLPSRMVTFP